MMYVAGETESASTEAVSLIESIIRNQVIHLVIYPPWHLVQLEQKLQLSHSPR